MMLRWEEIVPEFDTSRFDCGDDELNDFLRNDALTYDDESFSKTFLFFDEKRNIIGFATTCTDSIQLSEKEKKRANKNLPLCEFPGVKIARLAVDRAYQSRGYGRLILRWTIGHIKEHSKALGARFVTVDSVSESIGFYEKFSLVRNLHKHHKRRMTTSMRLDMHVA